MFKEITYQPVARGVRLMDRLRGHKRGVPIGELAEEMMSSPRTVRRDLRELERAGYLIDYPIVDGLQSAKLADDNVGDVPISRHERYALLAVRRVFDVLAGTPIFHNLKAVCSKLTDRMTAAERREFETFGERVVYIPHGRSTWASRACSSPCRTAS
jgi:DNA-binding transcriptional ArsR family regulator